MGQEEKNSNEFADYLFNSFVKADRKNNDVKWLVYTVLKKYAETGFPHASQEEERKYAEKLVRIIGNSVPDWRTNLLLLRGKEKEHDFKIQISKLEQRYRALGMDVDMIIDKMNEIIKLNDGND